MASHRVSAFTVASTPRLGGYRVYVGLILCSFLWVPPPLRAMQMISLDVRYDRDIYTIDMDIQLMAAPSAVYRVLSDYNQLHRLSQNIRQSDLLFSFNVHRHRIRTTTTACVLFFCQELVQVQDINEIEGQEIMAVAQPQKSHVKYATVHWQILPEDNHTRLMVTAQLIPDFWVPPLIGPWFIKASLREGMAEMVENIEYYASLRP